MYSEQYSTSQYSHEISFDSPHNSLGLRWHLACEPDVFEAYEPHNQEHVHACSTHSSLLDQRGCSWHGQVELTAHRGEEQESRSRRYGAQPAYTFTLQTLTMKFKTNSARNMTTRGKASCQQSRCMSNKMNGTIRFDV